jgi:hypothetical protein
MAISRKPKTVDEFISAGSTVPGTPAPVIPEPQSSPEPSKPEKVDEEMTPVTLRVPADILAEVDASAKKRRPRCSRNSWILEAMLEKLEREEKKGD